MQDEWYLTDPTWNSSDNSTKYTLMGLLEASELYDTSEEEVAIFNKDELINEELKKEILKSTSEEEQTMREKFWNKELFEEKFTDNNLETYLSVVESGGFPSTISGYIRNPKNDKIVYISVDCGILVDEPKLQFMFREVDAMGDRVGQQNMFPKTSAELIEQVVDFLCE